MWEFNGVDDATRFIIGGYYEGKPLRQMLSLMFKGKALIFPNEPLNSGFSTIKPMQG